MKRLLIAGCGDLGIRLAASIDARSWQVHGLRRGPEGLPEPIRAVAADLDEPSSLDPVRGHWDAVIYQATPGVRDETAYRRIYVDGLRNLFAAVSCERLIFVSSTAVFGQNRGEWVDETSPTEPAAFTGRVLLKAEELADSLAEQVVRVRFSGIYGPGRNHLVRKLRSGQAVCREQPPQWTNRIHADDCAGVLAHLLELADPLPVYCASDNHPAPRCEVLDWLAGQLGVPLPGRVQGDEESGQGKRIANQRLRASGYTFIHPDFRHGYGALLE